MEKLTWNLKWFEELSPAELYELLQVRSEVFVIEQQCIYPDMDNKDKKCLHLMGRNAENGTLVAYSRIVPPGISYTEPSIGRVLTAPSVRSLSYGKELLEQSIAATRKMYPQQSIRIGAQTYLIRFYHSFGFQEVGEVYDEDGIDHIEMILK